MVFRPIIEGQTPNTLVGRRNREDPDRCPRLKITQITVTGTRYELRKHSVWAMESRSIVNIRSGTDYSNFVSQREHVYVPFDHISMTDWLPNFMRLVSWTINLPGWKMLRMTITRTIIEPSNPTVGPAVSVV